MRAERIFQIAAVVLAGTAAYFFWAGNSDMTFAAAVVGACCLFIGVRFQIRDRQKSREAEYEVENESADADEVPERTDI
jgi:hypothetical protein